MRIVVTGATGNVGTSVVAALGRDERVESITAIARRIPAGPPRRARAAASTETRPDEARAGVLADLSAVAERLGRG
jgi:uncharacterized protein YbjT (DUF2867 family)